MTFTWPGMLWLLATAPLLVYLYLFLLRRKRRAAIRYASLTVVREAAGRGPGKRRHIPPALLLAAWIVTVVAMARPATWVTLPSQRDLVIMAMDVSGSMRAGDVEPDRITASQLAARDFLEGQPAQTRVGIVAFAGAPMLVHQPSTDRASLQEAIERFRLQRGTNIGGALLVALQAIFPDSEFDMGPRFQQMNRRGAAIGEIQPAIEEEWVPVEPGSFGSAAIVLLTDGRATTGPDPIEIARFAADRGVRVFTVGFGSRDGEVVGFGGWSQRVRLDEETLRQVAEITRGRYFHAASGTDLAEVYRSLTQQFILEREMTEVTAIFAGLAGVLTLLAAGLSLFWFNRIA